MVRGGHHLVEAFSNLTVVAKPGSAQVRVSPGDATALFGSMGQGALKDAVVLPEISETMCYLNGSYKFVDTCIS